MKFAKRLDNLGTETAFAVAAEAAAHASQGNRVYPFHLGDLNFPTPKTVTEAAFRAMKDGKTGYCPNTGIPELRQALAEDINKSHGTQYSAENVAIQPGGKPTIGKFILALMNPGDEALYPNPGFPIYESQIEFHGGRAVAYGFREGETNFEMKVDEIENAISDKTRILIVNDLHNPTGAVASHTELQAIADLAQRHDLYVLSDEAYFDVRFEGESQSLASFPGMADRCAILYTFSKKFAMTGWRLGATIGPKSLIDVMAKLNVNDESCSNHFIQYGALAGLTGDPSEPREIVQQLKVRRDKAVGIFNSIEGIRCYSPEATFYLFPNVTEAMKNKGFVDYDVFRKAALEETGVSFCTRLHFGRLQPGESDYYIRLAYSGIDVDDIEEGLGKLKLFLES